MPVREVNFSRNKTGMTINSEDNKSHPELIQGDCNFGGQLFISHQRPNSNGPFLR